MNTRRKLIATCAMVSALLAGGCTTNTSLRANADGFWCDLTGQPTSYRQPSLPAYLTPAYPRDCFAGDMQVASPQACVVGASCYQLDTGAWCTSEDAAVSMAPMESPEDSIIK